MDDNRPVLKIHPGESLYPVTYDFTDDAALPDAAVMGSPNAAVIDPSTGLTIDQCALSGKVLTFRVATASDLDEADFDVLISIPGTAGGVAIKPEASFLVRCRIR